MTSPGVQIQNFINKYYTSVDTEGQHDTYAQCFAVDAVLTAPDGSLISTRDALRRLHTSLWDGRIKKRRHTASKMFFPEGHDELVVIGSVEYWDRDGGYTKKNLASHFQFRGLEVGNSRQIQSLMVWLS